MKLSAAGSARLRERRAKAVDDALLPLINVVFLLMIFFLLAGRIGGLTPPAETARSIQQDRSSPAAPRVLEILPEGRLAVGDIGFAETELATRAAAWRGEPLDVRARGDIPADRALRTLNTLRAAGVDELRLLTVRARGG